MSRLRDALKAAAARSCKLCVGIKLFCRFSTIRLSTGSRARGGFYAGKPCGAVRGLAVLYSPVYLPFLCSRISLGVPTVCAGR